jgi:hypothetical protein
MSAYTPGPWIIDDGAIYGTRGIIRPFVASVEDDHNDGETAANARLIASAPELARLLSRLAGFAAHHASDSAMAAGGRDLVADARALLARIEGAP